METEKKRLLFRKAFTTGTYGCSGECHCGIHHFDSGNQWDNDHENTLARAEEWQKESSEQVQFHNEAIEYLNFDSKLFVIGCRCKMDEFIFTLLNEHKDAVLSYYLNTKDKIDVTDVM